MNRRTLLAAASAAFFSSACGGGGGGAKPTRALYGDSLAYGAMGAGRIAVPPCERLHAMDFSQGGMTLGQAFGKGVPKGSNANMPFPTWPGGLLERPADLAILWFGGASALFQEPVEQHEALYLQAVQSAQSVGMRVVMVGTYPRFAAYDAASARVARQTGSVWVDLASAVPNPELPDGLHASQATSDLWCSLIEKACA